MNSDILRREKCAELYERAKEDGRYSIAEESKRGKNTREALTSAKVRKGQARKASAIVRAISVDSEHSAKIDKRISNKAQKLAKREKKRAGLLY